MRPFTVVFGKTSIISFEDFELSLFSNWKIQMNARNRQKPICWKHLDGWIFFSFIWSRLKMHKLPPAKNCSSISSEIQWIFMVRCPCKTTKEAARDWKEKKDYMKNKKKSSKSVSIFTQKLFVNKMSSASHLPIWLWRSLNSEYVLNIWLDF